MGISFPEMIDEARHLVLVGFGGLALECCTSLWGAAGSAAGATQAIRSLDQAPDKPIQDGRPLAAPR